MKHRRGRHRLL